MRTVAANNTVAHAITPLLAMLAVFCLVLVTSQTKVVVVDAFLTTTSSTSCIPTRNNNADVGGSTLLHLARKYIVIGGNIDGINPNQAEDTYNMSKKERRRREREAGEANFKSGAYKKKQTMKEKAKNINFDKLDDKVSCWQLSLRELFVHVAA